MKIPAIFSGIPVSYLVAVVIFGLAAAFGMAAFTHQPLAVQVQINQYQPIQAPAPAIPTQAPQLVVDHTVKTGKFDPAAAPVVVTTQPLPTITPEPTQSDLMCDVNATDPATMTACMVPQMANTMLGLMLIMFILAIVAMVFPLFGGIVRMIDNLLSSVFGSNRRR